MNYITQYSLICKDISKTDIVSKNNEKNNDLILLTRYSEFYILLFYYWIKWLIFQCFHSIINVIFDIFSITIFIRFFRIAWFVTLQSIIIKIIKKKKFSIIQIYKKND